MAVTGTLEQIRAKVRKIVAMPSSNQLADADLDNYINDFYTYDLPEHLRLWNLHGTYNLNLVPHDNTYVFPFNTYTNLGKPCYIDGYEIPLFQDSEQFFARFPSEHQIQTLATATGIVGPYTGTLTGTPVTPTTLRITATDVAGNSLVATDTAGIYPAGTLAGGATGTVNYTTGAIGALTFTGVIPNGNLITAHYLNWAEGRPQAVLIYAQALIFYPVPDIAYEFTCSSFNNPTALSPGDQVMIRDWWNLVAYGAALKIFAEQLDMESYQKADVLFQRQMLLVERRTLVQIKNERVATIYNQGIFGASSFNSIGS